MSRERDVEASTPRTMSCPKSSVGTDAGPGWVIERGKKKVKDPIQRTAEPTAQTINKRFVF